MEAVEITIEVFLFVYLSTQLWGLYGEPLLKDIGLTDVTSASPSTVPGGPLTATRQSYGKRSKGGSPSLPQIQEQTCKSSI